MYASACTYMYTNMYVDPTVYTHVCMYTHIKHTKIHKQVNNTYERKFQ